MRIVTVLAVIAFAVSASTVADAKAKKKTPPAPAAKTETFSDLNANGIKLIRNLFMFK
jgi:hypothetical protein